MAKDKFKKMQQGGGVGSFQETLVQAATTVAAIERLQEQQVIADRSSAPQTTVPAGSQSASMSAGSPSATVPAASPTGLHSVSGTPASGVVQPPRFMRLPNPQIPMQEYNLVSSFITQFANMTRQDFVELAIIEKLHNEGCMTDEDFSRRHEEIRNRPTRGQRKGMKASSSSSS